MNKLQVVTALIAVLRSAVKQETKLSGFFTTLGINVLGRK